MSTGRDKGWGMPSKAMKPAGVVAMTLVSALEGSAALAGSEDTAYSAAQGEGPATSRS